MHNVTRKSMKGRMSSGIAVSAAMFFSFGGVSMADTGSYGSSRPVAVDTSVASAHSFTLPAARHAVASEERNMGLASDTRVDECRWVTPRRAACRVVFGPARIFTSPLIAPVTLAWEEYVTRPIWSPDSLYVWIAASEPTQLG